MTEQEKQELKQEIINQIKSESQDVTELEEVDSLTGVNSLPAMRGTEMVTAPISLLGAPATAAAQQALAAKTQAEQAAGTANTAASNANDKAQAAQAAANMALSAKIATEQATQAAQEVVAINKLNAIRDIGITDPSYAGGDEYYVSAMYKRSSWCELAISRKRDGNMLKVCNCGMLLANLTPIVTLAQIDGSGVSGEALVDWNSVSETNYFYNNPEKLPASCVNQPARIVDYMQGMQPKEAGKGLSTNDYTNEEKNKVKAAKEEVTQSAYFAACIKGISVINPNHRDGDIYSVTMIRKNASSAQINLCLNGIVEVNYYTTDLDNLSPYVVGNTLSGQPSGVTFRAFVDWGNTLASSYGIIDDTHPYVLPAGCVSTEDRSPMLMDEFEKLNRYFGKTITKNITLEAGAVYERCVFLSPNYNYDPAGNDGNGSSTNRNTVTLTSGVTLRDCRFVNTILNSGNAVVKDCVIEHCHFIGQGSVCYTKYIENSDILFNEFEISHADYPNATPRTKSEESRNIRTCTMNHCRIIGNHIYCGRTGILYLGGADEVTNPNLPNISSEYNVIKDNIIEGIGEECISFDGGFCFDVGHTSNVEVTLQKEECDQGQAENLGQNQWKYVALVKARVSSLIQDTTGFSNRHVRLYNERGKGWYVVNVEEGDHAPLDSYVLKGSIATDPETNLLCSTNGLYEVTFRVPTKFNYKDDRRGDLDPESAVVTEFLNGVKEAWEGKTLFVGSMQMHNTISGNIINGIGTDKADDIETMGGIVLYGMCFHNAITGNSLREKRIWLQGWNIRMGYMSKIKMQCFNTIASNSIDSQGIGIVYYDENRPLVSEGRMNIGNICVGNSLFGGQGVALFVCKNTKKTQLIGNSAYEWDLYHNESIVEIGNVGV